MTAVLKHELRNYFHSLTAYVFGAFLLAFVGIGAMLYNIQAAVSNFEFVLSFGCLVFVVIVPILTMRVIAEERKQRTDQLLHALPITTTQVIIGKYLALLAVYLLPMCLICLYPLIFSQYGIFYHGSRTDCPGSVYLFSNGQSGICRRNRHCGHSAELLQRQSFRICIFHGRGIGGCPVCTHPYSGGSDTSSDKKQHIYLYRLHCFDCRSSDHLRCGCGKI